MRSAPMSRKLHRGVRRQPLHVRAQFPGRQGRMQLAGAVQCVRAAASGASASEKRDLFVATASSFYRLSNFAR
jgi:hypothetical protein